MNFKTGVYNFPCNIIDINRHLFVHSFFLSVLCGYKLSSLRK
jgi:hypothetical protein